MRLTGFVILLLSACAGSPYDACELQWRGEEPALGEMVFDDDSRLLGGSYNHLIRNGRVGAGTFTVNVRSDGASEGTFDEALQAGLPFCRDLDGDNDSILFNEGVTTWKTDDDHRGVLAIASREGRTLLGMVRADLVSTSGQQRTVMAAFRLDPSD